MKNTLKIVLALVLVLAMSLTFVACGGGADPDNPDNIDTSTLAGGYDIKMWASDTEGVTDTMKAQIAKFVEKNPGIKINATVEAVSEGDAATKVIADVKQAPDLYCFAQDQLARLVQAAALSAPGKGAQAFIKANNDASSVAAATVGDKIYAYPMTSDNGYYMYYDKSVISEDKVDSMEDIIKACEDAGKFFNFELNNGWYTASFFFATGCVSTWTTDNDGTFTAVNDTLNSDKGLIAMKGMEKLTKSTAHNNSSSSFANAAVVVTGAWNSKAAEEAFGDNLGATDLPSFTVDGQSYHLGSYSGNKMMGVKPQTDAKRGAVLSLLAQYLTNEANQIERFETYGWGPSNINAQANDKVKANISLSALALQNKYAIPQGQIKSGWFDLIKLLGPASKDAADAAALQKALTDYKSAVDALVDFVPGTEWTVIGSMNGDTNWTVDYDMTESPAGTWTSGAIEFAVGDEFKCRQGHDWTVSIGDTTSSNGNYQVTTAGTYKVQLVVTVDGTGAVTGGTITLIPVEA